MSRSILIIAADRGLRLARAGANGCRGNLSQPPTLGRTAREDGGDPATTFLLARMARGSAEDRERRLERMVTALIHVRLLNGAFATLAPARG